MEKNAKILKKKRKKKPFNYRKWLLFIKNLLTGNTVYKKFFRIYIFTIFVGAIFLYLPFSLNPGWVYENNQYVWYNANKSIYQTFSFFDSFFTSSSAFSDTGLTVVTTGDVFSLAGQIIIMILIQVGGLGLLAIIIAIFSFLSGRIKLNFEQRQMLHSERGNNKSGESYKVIYFAFLVIFAVEILGWIGLSFFFYYVKPNEPLNAASLIQPNFSTFKAADYYHNLPKAIWAGLFHIVSSINNAGFDILGPSSIHMYNTGIQNILSGVFLFALIIGGIGYPVFYDFYCWIKAKRKHQKYRISLFTKISISSYFCIGVVGCILILAFELPQRSGNFQLFYANDNNYLKMHVSNSLPVYGWGKASAIDRAWNIMFMSFSARSAGFSTLIVNDLTTESKWLISALMFIGASPVSTGGGIRTITLFLIIAFLSSRAMGRKYVSAFKRTIHHNVVSESFLTFTLAMALIIIAAIIVSTTGNVKIDSNNAFFEVISAFGTSGLTANVTSESGIPGLIALIILMFIGQLGVSATLLTWIKKHPSKAHIRYKYEDVRVS